MAYDTQELFREGMVEVDKKKLIFISDIFHALGISSSTFYEHFPKKSKEYKEFQMAIRKNSLAMRTGIRNQWYKEKGGNGKLYLYKLTGTREERERLSINYNKNEHSGEVDVNANVSMADMPTELLEQLEAFYEKQAKEILND